MRNVERVAFLFLLLGLWGAPARASETACITLTGVEADNDNIQFFIAPLALQVASVGCYCAGQCLSPTATFDFQDNAGAAITLSSSPISCSTGSTDVTFTATTGGARDLAVGEGLQLNVANTPNTHDNVTVCATFTP